MMSAPDNDFTVRREILSAQIARQREEFATAYLRLEKPIRYAEYSMRGFGFLRKNPWVFVAVPAAFNLLSLVFSLRKRKSPGPEFRQQQTLPKDQEIKKPLQIWIGRAWQLFQLYRRLRHYFP